MSDVRPTVQKLLLELNEVDDWRSLGVALGVPVYALNQFSKQSNGGVREWKIEVYQYWLNTADAPSWRIIVDVLDQLSYCSLARKIRSTYLQKPSSEVVETEGLTSPQIPADVEVIQQLQDLQLSFSHMLTDIRNLLANSDHADARFFLSDHLDTDEFKSCGSMEELLYQLRQGHVDTFNTHCLEQVLIRFEREDVIGRVQTYKEKMDQFLKSTTVLNFQQAVLCTAKPAVPEEKEVITITVSKKWANRKTLKDVMTLAEKGFEESHATFISFNVVPKSILITWFFPRRLEATLRHLAVKNSALFQEQDIDEVTVAGKTLYTRTGMLSTGAKLKKPRLKAQAQEASSVGALYHLQSLFDALSAHRNILEAEISGTEDQLSDYKELSESLSKDNEELKIRVDYLDKQLKEAEEAKEAREANDEQKFKLQEQLEALLRIHGDMEEEKEEPSDRMKVCQDLLTQTFANRSTYNSAVHLLQSKSLLSMEENLLSKLRRELPDERASSLLTALHIENVQGLLRLIDIMKMDKDLQSVAEEMLVELSKTEQVPSLKRVEQIGKIMTAQADEINHLKEQRTQLLHQRREFEKESKMREDELRKELREMEQKVSFSNSVKERVPSQREFSSTVIQAIPEKWFMYGLSLRIPIYRLQAIESQHPSEPDLCFLEVFHIWQSSEPVPFTWKIACDILKGLAEKRLVDVISEKYDVEYDL